MRLAVPTDQYMFQRGWNTVGTTWNHQADRNSARNRSNLSTGPRSTILGLFPWSQQRFLQGLNSILRFWNFQLTRCLGIHSSKSHQVGSHSCSILVLGCLGDILLGCSDPHTFRSGWVGKEYGEVNRCDLNMYQPDPTSHWINRENLQETMFFFPPKIGFFL